MDLYLRHLLGVVLSLSALAMLPGQAAAAIIKVTPQQSEIANKCTIIDAFLTAQSGSPVGYCEIEGDGSEDLVVQLEAETYVLTTATLSVVDESATAFTITVAMTIQGKVLADGSRTIISRDSNSTAFRLFRVQSNVTFRELTLSGGDAGTNCCGARHPGGAIYAEGLGTHVTIDDVIFDNNTAGHGGAISDANAVYSAVTFAIGGSAFHNNHAEQGGAIAVTQSGFLTITGSHFEDNVADASGGAIYARPNRGARIEVADSDFLRNQASGQAGGAISAFDVTLTRVTMRGNTARDGGGAVANSDGDATIVDSTFDGNSSRRGGAVHAMGRLVVSGSTFKENVATDRDGGAIFLDDRTGASRITNSTFSANHAFVEGTAISVFGGGLTLINDTITGNTTIGSWGPAVRAYWGDPTLWISNSIIAGNSTEGTPFDLFADQRPAGLISLGHNLIGSDYLTAGAFAQPGDQVGTHDSPLDPGLLPLGPNGGPTATHALSPTSLALDSGSLAPPGTDDACEPIDQSGVHRPGAGTAACDIGAFEHVITFPLTVHVGAGGSVVGLNGSAACVGGECIGTFDSDTIVKLEAQAAEGHSFVGWLGGGCEGAALICFVPMDGAQTVTATFHTDSAGTTTVLTSSANPAVNGQDVTFTAVVTSEEPAAGTPTGSVTFVNVTEGTVIGTAPLVGGTATLTRTPRSSAQVLNEIKAIYTGDGTFTASSDTIQQIVSPANTTITTTSSAAPSVTGQSVTFTAAVAAAPPGSGTPTGSVTFTDTITSTVLGTVVLDGTGEASVITAALPAGIRQIRTSYSGDQWFAASEGFISQIVNAAITTTVVTSSANPVVSGQPLTITATVSVTGPSTRTPTGSVTFEDMTANVSLGGGTLNASGVATINPALPIGTHTIVANYAGDSFAGASNGSLSQTTMPTTVSLDILEEIVVSDTIGLLPSKMLSIDESIVVSDVVTPLPSAMLKIDETVVVSDTVTPLPSAMLSINESVIVTDNLDLAPQSNTPAGTNVSFVAGGVTLLYASVTRAGATTVTATDPSNAPPPPRSFDYTVPPATFEISTTAGFSGPVSVCMTYPAGSVSPRAMHFEGGAWIDRTISTDTATRGVCASVTSLSPFAVFMPRAAEGRMTGDGALPGGHEFDFRVAERSLGDERGALTFTHTTPKSGKQKARTDTFRATEILDIVFWDDPALDPTRRRRVRPAVDSVVFTGIGKWNGAPGYSFEVEATDQGEPRRGRDVFAITIRNPQGDIIVSIDAVLSGGNIQSHRVRER